MRNPSVSELRELGSAYRIRVGDDDGDRLKELVGETLDGLANLDEFAFGETAPGGERTWREPSSNPNNAVVTACDIPPTSDADGSLDGLEVGVKDNIAVAGVPLTAGSEPLTSMIPAHDATVIERLRRAGARITAKTNLDEFASGGRATSHYGRITNPFDESRIAGGSSGGSAAAVANGRVDAALGTDTGGSVRVPAAMCGLVGVKPTYGLVPLTGVIENTYTFDHVGPLTSDVDTAARVLEAIAGRDPSDSASMGAAGHRSYRVGGYVDVVESPPAPEDVTVGVLEEGVGDGVTHAVEARTEESVERLVDAGVGVTAASLPSFGYVTAIKNAISCVELAAHWRAGAAAVRRNDRGDEQLQTAFSRLATQASGNVTPHYRSKLLAGAQLLEEHHGRPYTRAQRARAVVLDELESALSDVDVLALPTIPAIAPRTTDASNPEPNPFRNTRLANVTRAPAVSVPNGTVEGLPVGLQLVAEPFADAELLGVAKTVESLVASA